MDIRFRKNKFYSSLFRQCDEEMERFLSDQGNTITRQIKALDSRLSKLEKTVLEKTHEMTSKVSSELKIADNLIQRELKNKIILSQWTTYFLANSKQDSLDPLTFAFSRYAQSICLCYSEVDVESIIAMNVHQQLLNFVKFDSELVVGPALMGLVHLSIHEKLRPLIALAGAFPILCEILVHSTSKPILCQACKLCLGLARFPPNKSLLINSGCLHGILDLILGVQREIDNHIQIAALGAVVNITQGNDACRKLTVELSGIQPIITAIQTAPTDDAILCGIKAIGNIAFCSSYCAGEIIKMGGHLVLIEILQITDILYQPTIAFTTLSALSNMCNNENCQSHLAAASGVCEAALRICQHARYSLLT